MKKYFNRLKYVGLIVTFFMSLSFLLITIINSLSEILLLNSSTTMIAQKISKYKNNQNFILNLNKVTSFILFISAYLIIDLNDFFVYFNKQELKVSYRTFKKEINSREIKNCSEILIIPLRI